MSISNKIGIYPGSFDPITLGHLDIIKRSSELFDTLIVAVLNNRTKNPLFSADDRVKMIESVTSDLNNIKVQTFEGLLVDFAKETGAHILVRGLRATSDFEYELQMAQTNRTMAPQIDTVFLTTDLKYAYLSSSIVKEVASFGGDISHFLPESIIPLVKEKYK
ncbi:MAG: pantetheine-phosphate adenylyltransferase [Lachnospiraceae bacterium]|nr:pantetheine-phosphate adenylyltransferase [Lachnospiraceae bacterium]MBR6270714.1 pantetheine-phosphate adenylyltransferase [Lachnospiraceae bacterium]